MAGVSAVALLAAMTLAAACSGGGERTELLVGAAASLEPPFRAIEAEFQEESDIDVVYLFHASGTLARQIEQGAPVDVFASADASYIEQLTDAGLLTPGSATVFGHGRIAVVTELEGSRDDVLAAASHVAIANPEVAPYGVAARAFLDNNTGASSWAAVQPKLVYGANAAQVLQFVLTGNAETGIVPRSLVQERDLGNVRTLDVPTASLPEGALPQMVAVVAESGAQDDGAAFAAYLSGPQAQAALRRFGYDAPQTEAR